MARIRRPKKINGSEYTFGGGSAAEGGAGGDFVKIAKGNMTRANANHDGFLKSGDTVTVTLDAGTSIPAKDQYIYFDNAFETNTGNFTLEYTNGDTALPAGVSFSSNGDSTNTDEGEARIYGTPSSVGTNTFKIKGDYPDGTDAEQVEITYVLRVLPTGTTPDWSATSLPDRIIKDTEGEQLLVDGPITTYVGAFYSLSNVSGFATGVTPQIDPETGRVFVSDVGAIDLGAVTHSFTVSVDLGEYGVISQTFSGNISYGAAYGSRYWGPGNSYRNWSNGNFEADADPTKVDGTYWFAPKITSGALATSDRQRDTSPYGVNDGYGLAYTFEGTSGAGDVNDTTGRLSSNTGNWYIGSNDRGVRFKWTVPAGVESFCVVGVAGGCHGGQSWANDGGGSSGLAYVNNVTCTPGEEFLVRIGFGHEVTGQSSYWAGDTYLERVSNGEKIIYLYGAGYYSRQNDPGIGAWSRYDYGNDNRDAGAAAASSAYGTYAAYHGGWSTSYNYGAATAGYRGTGNGGSNWGPSNTGGARNGRGYSSTYGGSAGGGVGLDGNGIGCQYNSYTYGSGGEQSDTNSDFGNGQHGWRYGGSSGSGGSRGCYGENPYTGSGYGQYQIQGGTHGGGGGGAGTSWGSGPGGPGGLRIIWGDGRAFPNTYTTENPAITNQS